MPKININGIVREMTPAEAKFFSKPEEAPYQPEPSAEEHVAQLEREIADLKEALEMLLSGVVADA